MNYFKTNREVVRVINKNRTEALENTRHIVYTAEMLRKCLYHDIQDFTIKETKSDFEIMLSWRLYNWDKDRYSSEIIISKNGQVIQSLSPEHAQFIATGLNLCTEYQLCLKVMSKGITGIQEKEILDNQCKMVKTLCPVSPPPPTFSFVEIVVIVIFSIMACLIVTLIVYHFVYKRKVARRNEEREHRNRDFIVDDKKLEQDIYQLATSPDLPMHKENHTYADIELLQNGNENRE